MKEMRQAGSQKEKQNEEIKTKRLPPIGDNLCNFVKNIKYLTLPKQNKKAKFCKSKDRKQSVHEG